MRGIVKKIIKLLDLRVSIGTLTIGKRYYHNAAAGSAFKRMFNNSLQLQCAINSIFVSVVKCKRFVTLIPTPQQ